MRVRVTVSEIRIACRSMELFRFHLEGGRVIPPTGRIPGTLSHDQIAEPLMHALREGTFPGALEAIYEALPDVLEVNRELETLLHENILNPWLQGNGRKLDTEQVFGLTEATTRLATELAEILSSFARPPNPDDIRHWILPPETTHEADLVLPDGPDLHIVGRFDGVLMDPATGRVFIFDYKCKTDAQATADFLQLALYADLLARSTGLSAEGLVLYLGENGGTVHLPAAELDEMAHSSETMEFLAQVRRELLAKGREVTST